MARLRVIGLTLLALAVPTFAFGGEEEQSGPAALSVSASLHGCGLANAVIVCQIDTGWNSLEGADYYTVSVTRPDGSVVDIGQTAGTSRAIFVPYVGPGNYSVQVAAWGTPPGEDKPEVVAREKTLSTDDAKGATGRVAARPGGSGPAGESRRADEAAGSAPEQAPANHSRVLGPSACEKPKPTERDPDEEDPDKDAEISQEAPTADELAAEDETDPRADCP